MNLKISEKLYTFFILILGAAAIFSIIFIFSKNIYGLKIKEFNSTLKPIFVGIIFEKKIKHINNDDLALCLNDNCYNFIFDKRVNTYKFASYNLSEYDFRTKNISILVNSNLKQNIGSIVYRIGDKYFYYKNNEITNVKTTNLVINNLSYVSIAMPENDNYTGILNHFSVFVLSLFYNWQLYIFPYLLLIICCILFNKSKFKSHFKLYNFILFSLFFLAVFLRIQNLDYHFIRSDEIHTIRYSTSGLISVFKDPGNPPLFYFIEYIWLKFVDSNILNVRLIPFLFGILSVLFFYLIFKQTDKITLLMAMLLSCIDIGLIYKSQEARGYSLSIFLTLFSTYLLFNYISKPTNKRLILYLISTIFLLNNYYYLIIAALSNLFCGVYNLIQKKYFKQIKYFIIGNMLAFTSIIPYFVISFKNALSSEFNTWIDKISFDSVFNVIHAYFYNKYLFLIFCLLILINLIISIKYKNLISKTKIKLFHYSLYSLEFVLLSVILISILIKPIFAVRMIMSLYGYILILLIILITSVFDIKKISNKFKPVLFFYSLLCLIFYFKITSPVEYQPVLFSMFDYNYVYIKTPVIEKNNNLIFRLK